MTRIEHLLTLLSEECNETGQRASKAIRFGLNETQEGQELTNAQRIQYEFCDIIAVVALLKEEGIIDSKTFDMEEAIKLKKIKIEKWLEYSKTCGTINV